MVRFFRHNLLYPTYRNIPSSFRYTSMRTRTRLAILECDTPLPNINAQYGGYGGVFKALLKAGAKAEGYVDAEEILDISVHNVENYPEEYPDLTSVDALLLTGSSKQLAILTCTKY